MKARSSRKPRVSGTARRVVAAAPSGSRSFSSAQFRRERGLEAVVERLGFFSTKSRKNEEPVNKAALKAATKARFSTGGLRDFDFGERDGVGPVTFLLEHLVVISTHKDVTLIYASRVHATLSFKGTLTKNILSDDLHLFDEALSERGGDGLLIETEDKARFVGAVPDPNWGSFVGTLSSYGLEARATYTHAQIAKAAGSVAEFFALLYG